MKGFYVLHSSNYYTITFNIDLVTPCEEIDILVIIPPDDIPVTVDYFLMDSDTYQLPLFTVNFAVCELTYSFEVSPVLGQDGITFDSNAEQRIFSYDFDLDANYLGTYQVKAIASVS